MKLGIKNLCKIFMFLLIVVGMMIGLNEAFFYHDKSVWSTDARIEKYMELPDNSLDVLFVGSSNLMSGFNSLQLWKETGIQSYTYCSRAQTFAFTYAYLQDALKSQNPECVVIDAFSVFSDKSIYGLTNTDFHFSVNMDNLSIPAKWELVTSYVPKEEWLSYFFPLLKNHNYYKNWSTLVDETTGIFMGYCFADDNNYFESPIYSSMVSPMESVDEKYLLKIIDLCYEKNIELIVLKTPVVVPDESHSALNCVKEYCEARGVLFYDMSIDATEWGFNFGEDMLDQLHINTTGAEKITNRLGEILTENYDFNNSETHKYYEVWETEYMRMLEFRNSTDNY